MNLVDYNFTNHAEEQIQKRFQLTTKEVRSMAKYFKKGNKQSPFSVIRHKLSSYSHSVAYYNQKYNMVLICDEGDGDVITALYLDGRDGNKFQR